VDIRCVISMSSPCRWGVLLSQDIGPIFTQMPPSVANFLKTDRTASLRLSLSCRIFTSSGSMDLARPRINCSKGCSLTGRDSPHFSSFLAKDDNSDFENGLTFFEFFFIIQPSFYSVISGDHTYFYSPSFFSSDGWDDRKLFFPIGKPIYQKRRRLQAFLNYFIKVKNQRNVKWERMVWNYRWTIRGWVMCSTLPNFPQGIDKNWQKMARPSLRPALDKYSVCQGPVAEYKKRFNLATYRIHHNLTNHHRRIRKPVQGL